MDAPLEENLFSFPEKQCGNLTAPANGSIDFSSRVTHRYWNKGYTVYGEYGDVAIFRCLHCYEFEKNGSSTEELFCNSTGKWSGEVPTCQSRLDSFM